MIKRFIIAIQVDERNIRRKYPNFQFNWRSPKEFITYLKNSMEDRELRKFGYRVTVESEV